MTRHLYQCFGLGVASTLALPELPEAAPGARIDVEIREGDAGPDGVPVEPGISLDGRACILDAVGARIALRDGAAIIVQLRRGRSEADARPALLGAGLAILCHQRGLLPLHASAVRHGDGLAAFGGPSGAGKSTLAAALQAAGLPGYCDDLCVVRSGEGEVLADAGPLRLKLTAQSLQALGLDASAPQAVGGGAEKWWEPLKGRADAAQSLALRRLFVLRPAAAGGPSIRRLHGADAVAAVLGCIHRWPTARAMGLGGALLQACVRIAQECRVFELSAAADVADIGARAAAVLTALEGHDKLDQRVSFRTVLQVQGHANGRV